MKLSPEQQQGLRLLKAAQAEAAGLQPDMRAFVLWQASHAYTRINPARSDSLLMDAFRATFAIEQSTSELKECFDPEWCDIQFWLQKHILEEMLARSRQVAPIESLLASAKPQVREELQRDFFQRYIENKEFDKAREQLNQFADQDYYPYESATELLNALPEGRADDRLAIFSQALDHYAQHTEEREPTFEDVATLVLQAWRKLPPAVVLDAIDRILERAREADADREDNSRIGISTRKGDAYFASRYAFRLFQLMPILEELDKARAESVLRENKEVKLAAERYPQGLGSLGSEEDDVYAVGNEDPSSQAQFVISRHQDEIINETSKNPKQALADAMTMPVKGVPEGDDYSPRAATLRIVARMTIKKDAAVSKAALEELEKLAPQLAPAAQVHIRAELPENYLRVGDEDRAVKALIELVKFTAKIYELDNEPGDPNRAFKGMWPSAALWRRCIHYAVKLTPGEAEQIIDEIPDSEIKSFERVALGTALLGGDNPSLFVTVIKANQVKMMNLQ